MDESTAAFEESSRRTLAAIVFTDIVNSSALMQEQEERTLELVKRDLGLITRLCKKLQGKVLKSTGDGLLMYFDSAVQAVACALEVQGALNDAAKELPPEGVLKHRIGIHLGDVFVSESDVMGDGVNVAARLQGEAEPGGICISQTVYDVVKNRLAVKATYLGPRDLKNITEAVPVYQILLDATQPGGVRRAAIRKGPVGNKLYWLVGAILVAVVALAAVMAVVVLNNDRPQNVYVVTGNGPQADSVGDGGATNAPTNTSVNSPARNSAQNVAENAPPEKGPSKSAIAEARRRYLSRYDYTGMVNWCNTNDLRDSELSKRYQKLARLRGLLPGAVGQYTKEEPLVFRVGEGRDSTYRAWDNEGTVMIVGGGKEQDVMLNRLEPRLLVPLARAAAAKAPNLVEPAAILAEECRAAGLLEE